MEFKSFRDHEYLSAKIDHQFFCAFFVLLPSQLLSIGFYFYDSDYQLTAIFEF